MPENVSKRIRRSRGKEMSVWRRNNREYFAARLGDVRGKTVVDLGCGDAPFRDLFIGAHYIGVDFEKSEDTTIVADLTRSLPLDDAIADAVFLSNTLEHIPTPKALLAEAYRIVKPGGMIIGTVPFFRDVHQPPYDFFRYTNFMLERMLFDAGFRETIITPLGTPFDVFVLIEQMFFSKLMRCSGGGLSRRG